MDSVQIEAVSKISKTHAKILAQMAVDGVSSYTKIPTLFYSKLKGLMNTKSFFILAKAGGKTEGFIMYRIIKNDIYVYEIHVVQERRSEGIGSKLIQHLVEQNKGIKIVLYVHKSNDRAAQFYKKHGFVFCEDNDYINHFEMILKTSS
ncbi:hypothetical protein ENBRE01_2519 [Enteropsectra breve]|nr:hypothetical protein ENBRE01_2519 [Enteropsectra breve]